MYLLSSFQVIFSFWLLFLEAVRHIPDGNHMSIPAASRSRTQGWLEPMSSTAGHRDPLSVAIFQHLFSGTGNACSHWERMYKRDLVVGRFDSKRSRLFPYRSVLSEIHSEVKIASMKNLVLFFLQKNCVTSWFSFFFNLGNTIASFSEINPPQGKEGNLFVRDHYQQLLI